TFAAAYRALLSDDDREIALKPWLYKIARNRCLSVLRSRKRHDHLALEDASARIPATAGLAAEVEQREDLLALLYDLQHLPDDQRAALLLAELGTQSHDEIAAILDVPTAKIKALVFQAREALMSRRLARDADCGAIREQLSVARGSARRRRELRDHVAQCGGCREFDAEVLRQRAGIALLLPVAPSLTLKENVLAGACAAGGGGAVAAGGGAAGGAAATAAGGGLATGATAGTGTTAGGGVAAAGGAGASGFAGFTGGGAALLAVKAVGAKAVAGVLVAAIAGGGYVAAQKNAGDRSAPPAHAAPAQPGGAQQPAGTPPAGTPPAGAAGAATGGAVSADECAKLRAAGRACTTGAATPAASPAASGGAAAGAGACPDGSAAGAAGCPPNAAAEQQPGGPAERGGEDTPGRSEQCVLGFGRGCRQDAPDRRTPAADAPSDRRRGGSFDLPGRRGGPARPGAGSERPGGSSPRSDKCPGSAASVASGCKERTPAAPGAGTGAGTGTRTGGDRDGDGVPNRVDKCDGVPANTASGCRQKGPADPPFESGVPGDVDGDGVPGRANCRKTPTADACTA
ncbi:MAG TPA: RNA polymerase sigma factor, partial [Solirubrobacteraceae bacterium]|nr:RNA polymerase sigma factor [Solirubrobacteraceae bacterium]